MADFGRNGRSRRRTAARGLGVAVASAFAKATADRLVDLSMAATLGVALALGGGAAPLAAATTGRERLAADLEILTTKQLAPNKEIPDRDKPRTAQCLAKAIATDVPDADAAKLSDMFNRRAAFDKALERKWLTIGRNDAPARYQQVINAVHKTCPDLEPYVAPMF